MSKAQQFLHPLFGGDYVDKVMGTHPADIVAYWPMSEASGTVAKDLRGRTGVLNEIILNGTFETPGGGTEFSAWSETVSDGAIATEAGDPYAGSAAAKITSGPTKNTSIRQGYAITAGKDLRIRFWSKGDGTNAGRYGIYDETNTAWIQTATSTGNATGTWAEVDFTLNASSTPALPANTTNLRMYFYGGDADGAIGYFDNCSIKTSPHTFDGIYPGAGITYGRTGIGDGRKAIGVNGSNTYNSIGSDRLNAIWDPNKGSAIIWLKVDGAARWTDNSTLRWGFHPKSENSSTHYIVMGRNQTNNELEWRRRAGGTTFNPSYETTAPTNWFCMGFGWDIANTTFKGYYTSLVPGAPTHAEVFSFTSAGSGVDNWDRDTNPLGPVNSVLLAGSTSAQEWIGDGAHCCIWANRFLTANEFRHVMTLP